MIFIPARNFWNAASGWQDVSRDEKAFADFVGIHPNDLAGNGHTYIEVTEETARRIELLLGPHCRTIIKTYLIRHNVS